MTLLSFFFLEFRLRSLMLVVGCGVFVFVVGEVNFFCFLEPFGSLFISPTPPTFFFFFLLLLLRYEIVSGRLPETLSLVAPFVALLSIVLALCTRIGGLMCTTFRHCRLPSSRIGRLLLSFCPSSFPSKRGKLIGGSLFDSFE